MYDTEGLIRRTTEALHNGTCISLTHDQMSQSIVFTCVGCVNSRSGDLLARGVFSFTSEHFI
jgi:hypothetical protein